jgi:uncharacterized protein
VSFLFSFSLSKPSETQAICKKMKVWYIINMTPEETTHNAKGIMKKLLEVNGFNDSKIFLFGSRARNEAQKYSDIDLGILSPYKISPSLIFDMQEEIEKEFSLYNVQIVDLQASTKSFREKVLEYAKEI